MIGNFGVFSFLQSWKLTRFLTTCISATSFKIWTFISIALFCIQLFREKVLATIPKCNMGYDQYTVPDDCSCRTYFCCFPLALANTFPWPFVPILSNFFEKKENSKPPTMSFRIVASTFPDNLSRNSCISNFNQTRMKSLLRRLKNIWRVWPLKNYTETP